MKWYFFQSVARTLVILGLIVPMSGATAGIPDELRTRLDEVEALFPEINRLVEQEGKVVWEMRTTTDRELEIQLRSQHQEILRKISKIDKSILRILGGAVDLLSNYAPDIRHDNLEALVHETERLVEFLRSKRRGILSDPDSPDELVTELGIDMFLERATGHLRFLYGEEQKFVQEKPKYQNDTMTEKSSEGPEKDEATAHKRHDGLMVWFDRQETVVKAALIAAIVSIIGTLTTVVVAAIRHRE